MNFNDKLFVDTSPKVQTFKGHAQIDFLRDGKVVKRIEHDNAITPALSNLLRNQFISTATGLNRSFNINQFFGGCFLVDRRIDISQGIPTVLPSDVKITAHAGQEQNSSALITKRGSPNLRDSHAGDNNSYTFVWDWKTSEGLGDIGAVCLTHEVNGYNGIGTNEDGLKAALLLPEANISFKDAYNYQVDTSLPDNAAVIFNDDNTYWAIMYNSKIFKFEKRSRSISTYRFNDNRTLETHTAETTYDFPFMNTWTFTTMCVDNGYAYFFYRYDSRHLRYSKISLTDFSVVDEEIEFTFNIDLGTTYPISWNVNEIIVDNGYMYFYNKADGKVYKLNLNNIADIIEIENPDNINVNVSNVGNGNFFKSGDLIGKIESQNGFGIVNDKIIRLPGDSIEALQDGHHTTAYNNIDGAITKVRRANSIYQVLAPNFISTVNNLDNIDTKTADMAMKLTYTISEV